MSPQEEDEIIPVQDDASAKPAPQGTFLDGVAEIADGASKFPDEGIGDIIEGVVDGVAKVIEVVSEIDLP